MMKARRLGYWLLTSLFCVAMGIGGTLNLIRFDGQQAAMAELGYPAYLMSILGVAKVLGVIAILIPKTPLLKEWAYAGFTFDLIGASASHAFSGHSLPEVATPLFLLAIALGSYVLRPDGRRGLATGVPDATAGGADNG